VTVIVGTVTVYVPPAELPDPTSVAETTVPDVPTGTANVHVQAPAPLVLSEPDVHAPVRIDTVSNVSVTLFATVNPVPATVTELPFGPCPGVTVIVGTVTVYVPPAELPDPTSVAETTVPDVPTGTANVHVQAPAPLVLSEPDVHAPVRIDTVSNVSVTLFATVNPVPATVTELPFGPCPGVTVTNRLETTNVTDEAVVLVAVSFPATA
jgi:hypothetical protein